MGREAMVAVVVVLKMRPPGKPRILMERLARILSRFYGATPSTWEFEIESFRIPQRTKICSVCKGRKNIFIKIFMYSSGRDRTAAIDTIPTEF